MTIKNYRDITDQRFGRLIARYPKAVGDILKWCCDCDCGKQKFVSYHQLVYNGTHSCGCLVVDTNRRIFTTHGRSRDPEYLIWRNIIMRCTDPKHPVYKNYGGAGITIDPAWLASYDNFIEAVGRRPGPGYWLTRTDKKLGFNKDNCSWKARR